MVSFVVQSRFAFLIALLTALQLALLKHKPNKSAGRHAE